ncbi:MAG: ribokinase [Micromonosporaceae bacterium]|nr:ribokinase [Micromonosporaceae bacterium]
MAESNDAGRAAGEARAAREARRARVVVVGSANMDLVATTPTLPKPGETVLGRDFATIPGGKGANQAAAAARAGARCGFIGAVGSDGYGPALRGALEQSGVDVAGIRSVPGSSGVALIAVDDQGENTIVVVPGANASVTDLTDADRAAIAAADVLLIQLEVPLTAVSAALRAARDAGTFTVLNAAPAQPLPADLLAGVDLLVVNEVEAATLAGTAGAAGALETLLAQAPRVVLTLGAKGARYADRDGVRLEAPAPVITAVDTTAAGDAFGGALAVAWAERRPTAEALRWACAAGAVAAQRAGASESLPHRGEINQLYEVTYL